MHPLFTKLAKLRSKLQPHQAAAVARALKNNLILAHSTGSGKTLTSIAAADELGAPTVVLTPASLVENYKKEIAKHLQNGPAFDIKSLPWAVQNDYTIPKGSTVILDEAHSARNSDTSRFKYLKKQLANAGRIIALTGTPAYNRIADWGPLINLVAQQDLLPEDPQEFDRRYIYSAPAIYRDPKGRLVIGAKPRLWNMEDLQKRVAPYVDVYDKSVEKPDEIDEKIEVVMDPEQQKIYDYTMNELPADLSLLVKEGLPPSKSQMSALNTFLTGVRQVANTPEGYQNNKTPGPKIRKAVEILEQEYKNNPKLRALVYSNFKESGVDSVARLLEAKNIPHAVFHGGLSAKQKADIVNKYNRGEIPVLLGTGSASEGLDLKNTNLIQLLEPHFNESRMQQVIGRGIRYKSHDELSPEERKVRVQRFFALQHPFDGQKPMPSIDHYLAERSHDKDELIKDVQRVVGNSYKPDPIRITDDINFNNQLHQLVEEHANKI